MVWTTSGHRYSPGNDNYALACSIAMGRSAQQHNANSALSAQPYGADGSPAGSVHWRQKSMPEG